MAKLGAKNGHFKKEKEKDACYNEIRPMHLKFQLI